MEDALDKVALAARSGHSSTRHLTVVDDDLPLTFADDVQPIVDRLRQRIATLATDFQLSPRRVSLARLVAATVTAELIRIEDSYAENLHGYGAVASGLTHALDPALHELHDDWTAIKRALDGPDPRPPAERTTAR
jgi:hypothetical protein